MSKGMFLLLIPPPLILVTDKYGFPIDKKIGLNSSASISLSWPPLIAILQITKRELYSYSCQFVTEYLANSQKLETHCNSGALRALTLIDVKAGSEFGGANFLYVPVPSFIFVSTILMVQFHVNRTNILGLVFPS
jgi:hypothetical protein